MSDIVFTPPQTIKAGVKYIEYMEKQQHRVMPLQLGVIGDYLAPLLPGEICAVQAQTSNYKSGFINYWETGLAEHLAQAGREDEIVIHVDTETSIETLAVQDIAHRSGHTIADLSRGNVQDWGRVMKAASTLSGVRIFRIGASLGQDNMPELYLSNIYRAIKHTVSGELLGTGELRPACIFVDYLQSLPIDPEFQSAAKKDQRRLQVRDDVYRLRRMAAHFSCPVVVGVQSRQSMTGHGGLNMRVPGTYDGEETAAIAQRFDRIIGLWMPKTTHTVGQSLDHHSLNFTVEENTLFVKVNKQRGGLPAGRTWQCRINYSDNTIQVVN